ncbi:HlyD family secretion protein [Mucilaginibacter sp. SMC90]|jgi:HlyD family secretion protein|uniref:HlyD family efflux transporter periplasmic adaptor subunit n=1 Tax=Mucilaginibacter rubeus TaxID=2027860 RepID=A0A5C1I4T9_9SPHI|nr:MULTISPECIES: HlyD family efflux transporter periplasmic adaptor subunit [Mucilaginibacter]QEM12340.1 HlyD family efflux transporter periplasmic adaptor subunit [Mucilaginibacter rubeus]UOE48666.1 HlyD family secretion protein [Mucilaginibacter sp. SMC90]
MESIIKNHRPVYSEDINDIIFKVPSWIVRWGTTVFWLIIIGLLILSTVISYPDVIRTSLKVSSENNAKPLAAKVNGKIVKLFVKDHDQVFEGQVMAYLESIASHDEVLKLLGELKQSRNCLLNGIVDNKRLNTISNTENLGELEGAYQSFQEAVLLYKASIGEGLYLKKRNLLYQDLRNLAIQKNHLEDQKKVQQQDLKIAEEEFVMHQKLMNQKVEATSEFRQQQSKYLNKKMPLMQTESSLISSNAELAAKQKELLELNNQVSEGKTKFLLAINSMISQCEDWRAKYVICSTESGTVIFNGLLQENQILNSGQTLFYIYNQGQETLGEMYIPQYNMGKVHIGQQVLIKLRSYPFEEYGMLQGKIKSIGDVPLKDSLYSAFVDIDKIDKKGNEITLKQGMLADAEIITKEASLFQRFKYNIIKSTNTR